MRIKTWAPAVLAVVLGGAAAKLVRDSMVKTHPTAVTTVAKTIQVTVAASDLIADQELHAESLTTATIPAPTGPLDSVANPSDILGRVISGPVVKGQTILLSNLKPKGATGGIASLVPAGMRAMTIIVDETNSIAGMLLPGCHVDVVTTVNAGKKSTTRTLIRNVLVQGVGQRLTSARSEDGKEAPAFHTITVIVSPREGRIIDLAMMTGKMRLLLRPLGHGDDADDSDQGGVTMKEITGRDDEDNVVAVAPIPTTNPSADISELATNRRTVELIKGAGAAIKVQFELPRPLEADIHSDLQRVIPGGEDDSKN